MSGSQQRGRAVEACAAGMDRGKDTVCRYLRRAVLQLIKPAPSTEIPDSPGPAFGRPFGMDGCWHRQSCDGAYAAPQLCHPSLRKRHHQPHHPGSTRFTTNLSTTARHTKASNTLIRSTPVAPLPVLRRSHDNHRILGYATASPPPTME